MRCIFIFKRYNELYKVISEVEMMLIKDEIDDINSDITFCQENYNWDSPGKIYLKYLQ